MMVRAIALLATVNTVSDTVTVYGGVSYGFDNTVTPEPATWMLLLAGAGILLYMRRKPRVCAVQRTACSSPSGASCERASASARLAMGLARGRGNSGRKLTHLLVLAAVLPVSSSLAAAAEPIALACPAASGALGVAYSSSLTATGGVPPYTFSISSGALPVGLTLDGSTGAITGTPVTTGTGGFTGTVVDSLIPGAGGSPDSTSTTCSMVITPVSAPVISGLSPSSAVAGTPAFVVTVNGSGFTNNSVVMWNGTALTTAFLSATQLRVPVNAGLIASPQSATVTVIANGLTSNGTTFTVEEIWTPIPNASAVTIGQIDPTTPYPIVSDWNTGIAFADYDLLSGEGMTDGYIQVLQFDSAQSTYGVWVVQNFPIENSQFLAGSSALFTFSRQATGPLSGIYAAAYHTKEAVKPEPKGNVKPPQIPDPPKPIPLPVPRIPHNIGPDGLQFSDAVLNAPLPGNIVPVNATRKGEKVAPLTPNYSVPQQTNECAPASVANSLTYLMVGDGATNIPSFQAPTPSRVAWLDTRMSNVPNGKIDPNMGPAYSGTASLGLLSGKNAYIAGKDKNGNKTNPAGNKLQIAMESQGIFCPTKTFTCPIGPGKGVEGTCGGVACPKPTVDFITNALIAKKDVEICLAWTKLTPTSPVAGHCVFVVGYQFDTNGFLKLNVVQDANQGAEMGTGILWYFGGHPTFTIGLDQTDKGKPPNLWILDYGPLALVTNVITEK